VTEVVRSVSIGVFLAVLGAAFLHAAWNSIVRTGGRATPLERLLAMALAQGVIGGAVVFFVPPPPSGAVPWILATAVLHTGYKLCLAGAYARGDLSRVYPIARGSAPLMLLALTVALGIDGLSPAATLAVAILAAGILVLAAGALFAGENMRLVPWALATGSMTAAYTLVDGLGVRAVGNVMTFLGWSFMLDGVAFAAVALALRGRRALILAPVLWRDGSLAAAGSASAYGIVVWAMMQAPIALVGALREVSILFALLIGWRLFGERVRADKMVAGALILAGMTLMRLSG